MATYSEYGVARNWKRGSLKQLVEELQRQLDSKIDFVLPTSALEFIEEGGVVKVAVYDEDVAAYLGGDVLPINMRSLKQAASARIIPAMGAKWVEQMALERPHRLAPLMTGLMRDEPGKWLVRTLDGGIRAILSDRYRIVDHWDLLGLALKSARELGAEPIEACLTETNMRLKLIRRDVWEVIETTRASGEGTGWFAGGLGNQEHLSRVAAKSWGELPGGPGTVHPVVTFSNSETGHGRNTARLGILQGVCFNIASIEDIVAQVHLGSSMESGIFRPETVEATQRAIGMMIQDAVHTAFEPEKFKGLIEQVQKKAQAPVDDPILAVDKLKVKAGFTDEDRDATLAYFLKDYAPTVGGLAAAVSRRAQDTTDPDRALVFEDLAGAIFAGKS